MGWESYFSKRILERGRDYYEKGKVKGFIKTADSCMARILGTKVYNTKVWGLKSDNLKFSCTCEYAKDGSLCKHEAALLFDWEEENEYPIDISIPNISLNADSETDTYYNVHKILREYEIKNKTLAKAQDIINDGLLEIVYVKQFYTPSNNENGLAISFVGRYRDGYYSKTVKVSFVKDKIINANCAADHNDRRSYYSYFSGYYNNLCEHEVALLLLAEEYIEKYNPGDETDVKGNNILSKYKDIISISNIDENFEQRKIIRLEPRLTYSKYDDSKLSISFRIGIEKMYVLKNLSDLVYEKERKGSIKLGKSYYISFLEYDFDEKSEKYYEMIRDVKKSNDIFEKRFRDINPYSRNSFVLKDKITLESDTLDRFFDISYDSKIEFKDEYGELEEIIGKTIGVGNGKLHSTITIDDLKGDKGNFRGLHISGKIPDTIKGKDYDYIIDLNKKRLARVNEVSPIVKLLLDNSNNGYISFNVGNKNLSEFYYRFLPELMDCPEIDVVEKVPETIQKALPPKCEITYYLDADEDMIIGKVSAKYGEEEIDIHIITDKDYPIPEFRDISFEQKSIDVMKKYLPDTNGDGDTFYCEKTGDKTFNILNDGIREMISYGEVQASEEFERLKIRKAPKVRIGVSVESGILNLEISTEDMSEEELLELLDSYRKKKKFHRLRSGEFIRLEQDDTIERLSTTIESMGVSVKEFTEGKLHLPLYRAIYINKLLEDHDDIAADRDRNFKSLIRNFNAVKDSDIEIPKELENVLRSYQKYGYKWLHMLTDMSFGGILADDMGLGKTLQVITLFLGRKKENENKELNPSIVICPASLVYNWEEEINRFAPELKVLSVTGTMSERKEILENVIDKKINPDILVTSYDLLKRDIANYENITFDIEIIDEAQYIKNAQAAVSKAVKVINSKHRFALTGTPIENRLSELWSIFDFLMPGFLYTYDRFRMDFENPITKMKDEITTEKLRKMVGPFILRRLKENVLKDLPDKMEEVRFAKFEPAQRKLYDAQVTHMKKVLESDEYSSGRDKIKVLAELTRIRQICCDPSLIAVEYKGESAKRSACIELVESAIDGGHRILIFSQFTSMLELLEKDLKNLKIEYYKITGQTSKEERIKLVHAFNENEVPVFLISLKAGGTGLNLIGADVVIHYDPWWNLAAQNQATDRAHRIGQTKKVSVFKIIVKNTIEEKILKMQEAKKNLADAILSGETESLSQLSKDELLELLS